MTERLYYFDSYLRRFDAKLVRAEKKENSVEVILDKTAFYPTSGGQPYDLGTIGGVLLQEALETEDNEIVHRLDRAVESSVLDCQIDWERRFDHMQQHSGQHVLSQAFLRIAKLNTVGFHMGPDYVTIDLDVEHLGPKPLEQAEKLANAIVFENRPVKVQVVSAEAKPNLGLRKETHREGPLRVVEIEDFDISACGGTHVRQTGEIGLIVVRKVERVNRQTRVEFVCGQRALAAQRCDLQNLTAVARQFSVSLSEAPERVEKQIQEARQLRKILQAKNRALTGLLGRELYSQAAEHQGFRIIKQRFEDEDMEFLKLLAQALLAQGNCVVLLGSGKEQAQLLFAQSEPLTGDLRQLLSACCPLIEGKGGGTRTLVQAGGRNSSAVQEALDSAERHLMRNST